MSLALEILKLLADTQRHRQKLAAVFGVLEALQATADNIEEYGEDIANSAADIFTALKFSKNSGNKNKKAAQQAPKAVDKLSPSEDCPEDEAGLFGALDTSNHSEKGHRFLKYNSKAKTITIQVTGLTTQVIIYYFRLLALFLLPYYLGGSRITGKTINQSARSHLYCV